MIFDIHSYSEEKKVKLVVVDFTDYTELKGEVQPKRNRDIKCFGLYILGPQSAQMINHMVFNTFFPFDLKINFL